AAARRIGRGDCGGHRGAVDPDRAALPGERAGERLRPVDARAHASPLAFGAPEGHVVNSRISRTIAWTLASEVASVVATAWITRRFAQIYIEREVNAYFVVRQVLGWVLNVGFFGLNVSLPRALARAAEGSPAGQRRQVAGALLLSAPL